MTDRQKERLEPRIARLLEQAGHLLANAGDVSPRAHESFAVARRAYQLWQGEVEGHGATRWLHVLGARALAVALDVYVGRFDAKPAGPDTAEARRDELSSLLLEICAVTASPAAGHDDGAAVDRPPPLPPPPPLVGSFAMGSMLGRSEPGDHHVSQPPLPAPFEPAPSNEPQNATEEAPMHERYPLTRCAAIAASVARRRDEKATILDKHELSPAQWAELQEHWADAIKLDLKRGKATLLASYDEAYVAQLEAERGPIGVEEYAKLVVAAERGVEPETLVELDLPQGATLRLNRVWLRKTMQDKTLARRVRDAVAGKQ